MANDDMRPLDLDRRFAEIDEHFTEQRQYIEHAFDTLGTELRGEMHTLRTELRGEIRALSQHMERRFQAVDSRFEAVDNHFEAVDNHFEAIDRRFDGMERRFDSLDGRFDSLERKLDWFISTQGGINADHQSRIQTLERTGRRRKA
jgi:chromosome segregation ATPase